MQSQYLMERPTLMKLRRKGIRPESSGIDSFIDTCPACGDEDKTNRESDHFHGEIRCTVCGHVIADSIEYKGYFLMLVHKEV